METCLWFLAYCLCRVPWLMGCSNTLILTNKCLAHYGHLNNGIGFIFNNGLTGNFPLKAPSVIPKVMTQCICILIPCSLITIVIFDFVSIVHFFFCPLLGLTLRHVLRIEVKALMNASVAPFADIDIGCFNNEDMQDFVHSGRMIIC